MIERFYHGQKLQSIFWEAGGVVELGDGELKAKEITISMESGQMSGVPWVYVRLSNGKEFKYNLDKAEGVILLEEQSDESRKI